MGTTGSRNIGGHTGLGLLGLMALALVAGELEIGPEQSGTVAPPVNNVERPRFLASPENVGRETIRGAIRELRILPATIEQRIDLNWTPDERLLDEYRRTGI